MSRSGRFVAVILFALSFSLGLLAQTPDTATIRGKILDQNHAAVSGASVSVVNSIEPEPRTAQTDEKGQFSIAGLPITGTYKVDITKSGFGKAESQSLTLVGGGTADVTLQLSVAGGQTVMTVTGDAGDVRTDEPQLGDHLDATQIEETPLFNNQITYAPLLNSANRPSINMGDVFMNENLITTNGGGRRQTAFEVDGVNANDSWGRQTIFSNVPVSAVQEMSVLENGFSAQYGFTTGGVVNVVTKTGSQQYHGELDYAIRPNGTEASLVGFNQQGFTSGLASGAVSGNDQTTDNFNQAAWAFSGPLGDKTQVFVSGEFNDRHRGSPVTSPVDPTVFVGVYHDGLIYGDLDHQFNSSNSMYFRTDTDSFYDTNPNGVVGGNSLPSVARIFSRRTYSNQLGDTWILSPTMVNVFRVQYQLASPITAFAPVNDATADSVNILNLASTFTSGTSTSAKLLNHQYEANDTVSSSWGRHTVKFGGDAILGHDGGNSKEFGGPNYLGTFTFTPCPKTDTTLFCETTYINTYANAASFTQSFGSTTYTVDDNLYSGFVQDDFHVQQNLTVNLGLRYEKQTFTDSNKDFAPRVGFSYSPWENTVVRGGFGIYYSQIVDNSEANYVLSGPTGVFTLSANAAQPGFPSTLTAWPSLAAAQAAGGSVPLLRASIYLRPGMASYYNQFFPTSVLEGYPTGLWNPYSEQWTLGIEHRFAGNWVLDADYVGTHTLRIVRPLDLDAPPAFTRTAQDQWRGVTNNANGTQTCNATGASMADDSAATTTCASNAANAARPLWIYDAANKITPAYEVIQSDVNDGIAWYDALELNLNHRFTNHFQMLASYTWSHTLDTVDQDSTGQNPNDASVPGIQEKGNALYDQRQRFVLSGYYILPYKVTIGGVNTMATGLAFNPVTGTTNGGDSGGETDRPVINGVVAPRNSGRGSDIYSFDPFVERPFRITERLQMNLRAQAFNAFNHGNFAGFNATYGNTTAPPAAFGTNSFGATSQFIAREVEFSVKLTF